MPSPCRGGKREDVETVLSAMTKEREGKGFSFRGIWQRRLRVEVKEREDVETVLSAMTKGS